VTNGGIGLGTVGTSAIFLMVIVSLVSYISLQQKRQLLPVSTTK
jgi:uncharacterized membrane-anchored protein